MSTTETTQKMPVSIPIHQWTDNGDRVLLVKCVDGYGRGRSGFQWPKSGQVKPEYCSREPDCESGGLFGWPWGVGIGDGKAPEPTSVWIVFSARPEQVISLGGKAKVAADTADEIDCEVIYYGDAHGAIMMTHQGRIRFAEQNSLDAPKKKHYESVLNNEPYGSTASRCHGGLSSTIGDYGSATSSGDYGLAASRGSHSAASSSGPHSTASIIGDYGLAANSGRRSLATNSGHAGVALNSGERGLAVSSGFCGTASSSGDFGIACATGGRSTIEVGPCGLGAVTANHWFWRVRTGAVVAARWNGGTDNYPSRQVYSALFDADALGLADGDLVEVIRGVLFRDGKLDRHS